jgi:hypothetical protein
MQGRSLAGGTRVMEGLSEDGERIIRDRLSGLGYLG